MNILHLSSERTWRGGEQQVANLITASVALGITCHCAVRKGSAFEAYCKQHNIPCLSVSFANEFDVFTALKIKKYCKQHSIDILHMHSSHSHAMGVWSHLLGNPAVLVLSRRVDFPVKRNWFSRFKFNYKGIKAIICVSEAIKNILAKDLTNTDHCYVAHSGIDLSRFEGAQRIDLYGLYDIPRERKIVANISAVAGHKDYYTFIATAEQLILKEHKLHFLIIGDGPLFEDIKKHIYQKKLESHITMTGFKENIPSFLKSIDLFLMTSKTEGLGTTLLDAFANHVPVVATAAGGIPEIVEHEKTGLLAEVKDVNQLTAHVERILGDPDFSVRLTTAAYQKLMEHFTIKKMAEKNVDIYKKALKK